MANTARDLFDELSRDYKPNRKRPEIGEICTLVLHGNEDKVVFSIGWYDMFEVNFNPKTIKIKYDSQDRYTKEHKHVTKQVPLDTPDLLNLILDMYQPKSPKATKC